MTSKKSKRVLLGFDDSDDEEDQTQQIPALTKRARILKPIFKPASEQIGELFKETKETKQSITFTQPSSNEDGDYLNMTITEDATTGPQRLSKAATESEAAPDTLTRLKTSLFGQLMPDGVNDPLSVMAPLPNRPLKSKGLKMMEKMGFKVGETLGKDSHNKDALLEPILVIPRANKGGILMGEKEEEKRTDGATVDDENEFKKWYQGEKKQAKLGRIVRSMQKQCFEFEDGDATDIEALHLKDLNVMWRGYVRSVQDVIRRKREEKMPADENGEKFKEVSGEDEEEEEEDQIDDELEMFEQQSLEQKLTTLNAHLRSDHDYCFFCGVKYEDQGDLFANCPGSTEAEHL